MYCSARKAARVIIAAILGLSFFVSALQVMAHPVSSGPALFADDNGAPTKPTGG